MKGAATEQVGVLTIDRIAAGGDGVGRLGGLAVFVPRTAPGDVVQVAYRVQGRLGRGRVLQVITPSTQRVDARCAHYERDACGGCQLQHLDAATQQQARREIVRDTLARIGRREVPLPSLVSGAEWAYRTRLTVALRRRGSGWLAGLHRHDAGARLFSLEHCEIVHPLIDATWSALRSVVERAVVALPSGETLRLSLRLVASTAPAALEDAGRDGALHATAPHATGLHAGAQIHVVVQGGEAWPEQMEWQQVAQQRAPAVTQVHWVPAADADVELMVPEGPEVAEAQAFAHAFAQVNAEVADAMHQHVLHTIGGMQARHVVDGYAGTGRLSRALVEHGATVVSVELDSEAVRTMEWQHEALSAEQGGALEHPRRAHGVGRCRVARLDGRCGGAQSATRRCARGRDGVAGAAPRGSSRGGLRELQSRDAGAGSHPLAVMAGGVGRVFRHVSADGARGERVRAAAGEPMKYLVDVNGQRVTVELDGAQVTVDAGPWRPH
jgi:23S rRNA (uracil1939-C5)-methyltransferase